MTTNLFGGVIESAFDALKNLFNGLSYDIVFAVAVGLMVAFVIVAAIRIRFSFEKTAVRSIKKMNKYMLNIIGINEDNLLAFHKNLQKMPQKIRERWQLYILEREGLPSRYLTAEYCIRRPLASSVMKGVQKQVKLSAILISIITFILGFPFVLNGGTDGGTVVKNLVQYCLVTPMIVMLIASVCNMIIERSYGSLNAKIYDEFEKFVRALNKAVATMPDSIDYQVLFSQKEIEEGIPVLREYLEKQKLEEQQMLEQSKYAALAHSPYDFQELGVDGEQLITRAVDESENFLMKKIGLQNEIQDYEKKLAQSQQNMDEIEKEANRKLQTIKENIERLNKAISETTNRVEINYNNRQIKDEMEKRAAVEKDLRSLLAKEQVVLNECNVEIQKRKEMIEKDKDQVEVALKSEYNTFAVKVYDTLSNKLSEEHEDVIKDYQNQMLNANLKAKNLARELEEKDSVIAEKDLVISNLQAAQQVVQAQPAVASQPEQVQAPAPEPVPEVVSQPEPAPTEENLIAAQDDAMQDQVFYDESGAAIDYSQYFDENGNFIGGDFAETEVAPQEGENAVADETLVVTSPELEQAEETNEEQPAEQVGELSLPYEGSMQLVGEPNAEFLPVIVEKEKKKPTKTKKQASKKAETKSSKPKQASKKKSTTKKEAEPKKSATSTKKETKAEPKKKTAAKTAAKQPVKKGTKKEEVKKPVQKKQPVKTTSKKKASTIKVAQESLKSAKTEDDFNEIQKQINKEQKKLKQNKDALQDEITKALSKMENSSTKTSKATSIKKIKELIDQLKEKAKQAKQNGANKEEIKSINASVAELVEALTKFSSKK